MDIGESIEIEMEEIPEVANNNEMSVKINIDDRSTDMEIEEPGEVANHNEMSVKINIDDQSTETEMGEIREAENHKEMNVKINIDDRSTEMEMEEIREVANFEEGQLQATTETNLGMTQTGGVEMQTNDYVTKMLGELPDEFDIKKNIFRLPDHEMIKELCEPKVVSIGPYHRGKPGLRTMEHQKWFTLRGFLNRNKGVTLDFYLQEMKSIEAKARQCYSEPVDLGSDEFVAMLLLDGYFILEWLIFSCNPNELMCVEPEYPIFQTGWNMMDLLYDLLLMENQLPYFVLHNLFAIQKQGVEWSQEYCIPADGRILESCSFFDLISVALFSVNQFSYIMFHSDNVTCHNIGHFLHLYYQGVDTALKYKLQSQSEGGICGHDTVPCFKLFSRSNRPYSDDFASDYNGERKEIQVMCVSELCAAGVRFKKKKNPYHILDISFTNGTIEMPFLKIDGHFVRLLWNMVAHEQIKPSVDSPFSSYLALMDSLIDTEKDIAILERAGIVDSYFSNAEEAAVFFNQFGKLFFLEYKQHHFCKLFRDVKKYSESTWHKYRARLVQDYFSSPWAIISVLAAVALFLLTGLQTYYSSGV